MSRLPPAFHHRLSCTDGEQGKSSLTVQFVDGHFVESYYPTIENTFSKVIKYKGQDYATEIIDTAGQVSWNFPISARSHVPAICVSKSRAD